MIVLGKSRTRRASPPRMWWPDGSVPRNGSHCLGPSNVQFGNGIKVERERYILEKS